jgi:hypothetical protein
MTVAELTKLARIQQNLLDALPPDYNGRRSLEHYCHITAVSLKNAMLDQKQGKPSRYTGKEGKKILQGDRRDRAIRSPEDLDDYVPAPGDPTGWGAHVVEAIITLARLCEVYEINLEAAVERRLRRYERSQE